MNGSENMAYFKPLEFLAGCYKEPARALKSAAIEPCRHKLAVGEPQVLVDLAGGIGGLLRRLPSIEELELLFSKLRGVELILATLSYGLKVRVSDLQAVRVRDVNFSARCIVIAGTQYVLPMVMLDDLRDYIQEKLCGFEASVTVSRREQRLFSAEDLESFFASVSGYQRGRILAHKRDVSAQERGGILSERCLNRIFRLLGRVHARCASKRGAKLKSPLDLFDKGPRIVRRGQRGVIDSYYIWRTAYLPALSG